MACWLLKTEPGDYSLDDLLHDKRTRWDGVSQPMALQNLRRIRRGDDVFIYHTGNERAIVGTARVLRGAYPDPELEDPRRAVCDIGSARRLAQPVTLQQIKQDPALGDWDLVRLGRLSVVAVSAAQEKQLRQMAQLDKKRA